MYTAATDDAIDEDEAALQHVLQDEFPAVREQTRTKPSTIRIETLPPSISSLLYQHAISTLLRHQNNSRELDLARTSSMQNMSEEEIRALQDDVNELYESFLESPNGEINVEDDSTESTTEDTYEDTSETSASSKKFEPLLKGRMMLNGKSSMDPVVVNQRSCIGVMMVSENRRQVPFIAFNLVSRFCSYIFTR